MITEEAFLIVIADLVEANEGILKITIILSAEIQKLKKDVANLERFKQSIGEPN